MSEQGPTSPRDQPAKLPTLLANMMPLRERSRRARIVLLRSNQPPVLFKHGGVLVDVHNRILRRVGTDVLRARLARVAEFERVKWSHGHKVYNSCNPPDDLIRDLLSHLDSDEAIPAVQGLTEWPIIAPNGAIRTEAGYDRQTELIYVPVGRFQLPEIPTNPIREDIDGACKLLQEIFVDFPFHDESSRTNAVAALITLALRPAIRGRIPVFAIDASAVGTGKTLIAQAIVATVTGRIVSMMPECTKDEEWSKTLTSVVAEGAPVLIIDNVSQKLSTPKLALFVTAEAWKGRLLGTNLVPSFRQNCVLIVTGNDLSFSPKFRTSKTQNCWEQTQLGRGMAAVTDYSLGSWSLMPRSERACV